MFKSIFAKYIAAITVITLVSFFILTSVITSVVDDYAVTEMTANAKRIADLGAEIIQLNCGEETDLGNRLKELTPQTENLDATIDSLVEAENGLSLLLVSVDGEVLRAGKDIRDEVPERVGEAFMEEVKKRLQESGAYSATVSEDDVLLENHIAYGRYVYNDEETPIAVIFACTSAESSDELLSVTRQSILMTCMWILLATLIAVYFITERITDPVKQMSDVAKKYAKGDFTARIAVGGRDEVAQLSAAFNRMADDLDQLERMRNSFMSNVSHELRTPMASIAGFIDGIRDGAIPPDKQPQYLDVISSEIQRLSRLVALLLDVSRLESGDRKMNFTRCNLCETARLVLISLEQNIENKKLNVEFDAEEDAMFVRADADALHQVLFNLCDNAIKFSHEGARLQIRIRRAENFIAATVYNEGSGIPAEDVPFVFDRFYKSDKSRSIDKKGVGLGLYLVKTILTAHGGDIRVESEEGKNCSFTFRLPEYREQ